MESLSLMIINKEDIRNLANFPQVTYRGVIFISYLNANNLS